MSDHPLRTLLKKLLLVAPWALFLASTSMAQPNLEDWGDAVEARTLLPDFQAFSKTFPDWNAGQKAPKLKNAVPALDDLEEALKPWSNNKELENRCIQKLLENEANIFFILNVLDALYRSDINEQWAEEVAYSYRWLPALMNGMNHTFIQDSKAGLWNTEFQDAESHGLKLNDNIDERFIPSFGTEAAMHEIQKLQRRFPSDPHRVLVAYVKGMAFATRWTGKPGFDKNLDEWLTLYKVVSRFMVNLERVDYQLDWMSMVQTWKEPSCQADQIPRQILLERAGLSNSDLRTFLPWWRGDQLFCNELVAYGSVLPPALINAWNRAQTHKNPMASESESKNEMEVFVAAASEEAPSNSPRIGVEMDESELDKSVIPCLLHEVKQGDTLWNISKRHPGTTPELIAEINDITDYIRIGQMLCIPKRE